MNFWKKFLCLHFLLLSSLSYATVLSKLNELRIGDHIVLKITAFPREKKTHLIRSISLYRSYPQAPQEGVIYRVQKFIDEIPNAKSKEALQSKINGMLLENTEDKNPTHKTFWFVDLNTSLICQYEDGMPIYNLLEIQRL